MDRGGDFVGSKQVRGASLVVHICYSIALVEDRDSWRELLGKCWVGVFIGAMLKQSTVYSK